MGGEYVIPYFCKLGILYFGKGSEFIIVPAQMATLEAEVVEPEKKATVKQIRRLHDRY